MKIFYLILYILGCIGIPWFVGWLTIGRDYLPEFIVAQWAFGLMIVILIGLLGRAFVGGIIRIKQK